MDIKEIAKKVVDGVDVKELTKDFDEAKNKELDLAVIALAREERTRTLDEISAIRKEKGRVGDQANQVAEEAATKVKSQIRGEQIEKAFVLAENKLSGKGIALTPEAKAKLREDFKTEDTGKFDAELIVPDILRTYAKSNADTLIDAQEKAISLEKNAVDFNAGGAGSGQSNGGGGDGSKKYAPEVYSMVKEAAKKGITMTLEQAERGMKGGARRFG